MELKSETWVCLRKNICKLEAIRYVRSRFSMKNYFCNNLNCSKTLLTQIIGFFKGNFKLHLRWNYHEIESCF